MKTSGVAYRRLVEGEELAVGIGLVTLKARHNLHEVLAALVAAQRFAE